MDATPWRKVGMAQLGVTQLLDTFGAREYAVLIRSTRFLRSVMDALRQKGYISDPATKIKSVWLTEKEAKLSEEHFEKLFAARWGCLKGPWRVCA
jgi:Domain of unknown function (DUF6429)